MATTLPTTRTYTQRGQLVVSRTVADVGTTMFFEITVIRSWRQKNPTYQGCVVYRNGSWHAESPDGDVVDGYTDYIDAEDALVAVRTGLTSSQEWTGPRPTRPACGVCDATLVSGTCPNAPHEPECPTCGWELVGGQCRRLDLHWTAESLAADEARRAARHAARNR